MAFEYPLICSRNNPSHFPLPSLRSLPDDRSKLPIIALTANAFEENRKDCLDAGMSEHVSKPIKIQSLLQTIGSVLKE